MTGKKTCNICGVEKDLNDFYRHSKMRKGRESWCKECSKKRVKKYKEKECIACGGLHRLRGKCCSSNCVKKFLSIIRNKKCNERSEALKKKYLGLSYEEIRYRESTAYKKSADIKEYSYNHIHKLMSIRHGKPISCDDCKKKGEELNGRWNIDWCNISGKYLLVIEDWRKLCRKCHKKFDKKTQHNKQPS